MSADQLQSHRQQRKGTCMALRMQGLHRHPVPWEQGLGISRSVSLNDIRYYLHQHEHLPPTKQLHLSPSWHHLWYQINRDAALHSILSLISWPVHGDAGHIQILTCWYQTLAAWCCASGLRLSIQYTCIASLTTFKASSFQCFTFGFIWITIHSLHFLLVRSSPCHFDVVEFVVWMEH